MICLTHIPKTGGTTLRWILINNYSWRHIDFPESKKIIVKPTEFPFDSFIIKSIKSLSGHWLRYTDDIKLLFPNIKYVTFLRDPISRIISLFFHIKRFENPDIEFQDWVDDYYLDPVLCNHQTRFIAGDCNLDRAKTILKKEYFFIGTTDLFDKSLLILKKMIGNNFEIRYEIKRKSKKNKAKILKDPKNKDAIEKLYENNKLDLQLNDFVKHYLFPKYQREFGEVSEHDIDEFRKSNVEFTFNKTNVQVFRIVKYFLFENMFRLRW